MSSPTTDILVRISRLELDISNKLASLVSPHLQLKNPELSQADGPTLSAILADANAKIRELGTSVQELHQLVEDVQHGGGTADDKAKYTPAVYEEHAAALRDLRAQARSSSVDVKAAMEVVYVSQRQQLLRGGEEARRKRQSEGLLNTTKDVTDTLRRTRQLLGTEMDRVHAVSAVMNDSGVSLSETLKEHEAYSGSVNMSKQIITNLEQRQRTDRILTFIGLALFISVVCYILYRRLRYVLSWVPGL